MKRAFLAVFGGLAGVATALVGVAQATPTAKTPVGRIVALPPAPEQPQAAKAAEPMRFAGNSSSNSSRNSSRNRSRNSSNNTSNNSSDDDRWRGRYR